MKEKGVELLKTHLKGETNSMGFSKDFLWGTATASYQIEGGAFEDGRGYTVWDDFCRTPGKVFSMHNGDVACDHYHRYKEDVKMMADMGIKAYRFSIAWSRILPEGKGEINQKGIDFYNSLIDELIKYNIKPCLTLFHWDLPFGLYRLGGWQNPQIVDWFAEYAKIVAENFGDRVKFFMTFNEPQCFIGLGHVTGEHAPGNLMSRRSVLEMAHHVMMAHGKAVQAIRSIVPDAQIGYAPTSTPVIPLTDSKEDIEAARKAYFAVEDKTEYMWSTSWWSDPVMLGAYPEDGLKLFEKDLPDFKPEDLKLMNQPIDFYGQNIYNGYVVKSDGNGGYTSVERPVGYPRTGNGWPVVPESLYWGPRFLYERYKKPIVITENGCCCADVVSLDGQVHDPGRIDFYHRYLRELKKAVEDGVDVAGYFAWSVMDNFEWAKGYSDRFGLVYVDYTTQERILKDSAHWYSEVIRKNGENL